MPLDTAVGRRLEGHVTVIDAALVLLLDLLAVFVAAMAAIVLALIFGPFLISVEDLVEAPLDLVLQLMEESIHREGKGGVDSF